MSTLVNLIPDSYNIDYFLSYYSDHYDISFVEADTSKARILIACFNPQQCEPAKQNRHYMCVPEQPQVATCLCRKYHTTFTSQRFKYNDISRLSTSTPATTLALITNLSTKLFNKGELLPPSSIKLTLQPTPTVLFPLATFVLAANVDLTTTSIATHTHHPHTLQFVICKILHIQFFLTKNIFILCCYHY